MRVVGQDTKGCGRVSRQPNMEEVDEEDCRRSPLILDEAPKQDPPLFSFHLSAAPPDLLLLAVFVLLSSLLESCVLLAGARAPRGSKENTNIPYSMKTNCK